MECNLSKQDVSCEKVLLNTSLEQPASVEFSLPDYCPDIERILKCCLTPVVNQKLINSDSLIIDGVVYINLLYCDSSKQIKSFEYPYPFNEKTELTNSSENAITKMVTVKPIIDGLSCKAITDRRVQVNYNISLKVNVTATFTKQVVTNIDCEELIKTLKLVQKTYTSPLVVAILNPQKDMEIGKKIASRVESSEVVCPASPDELFSLFKKAKFAISQRYHGSLFALSSKTPVLPVSNDPKMHALCRDFCAFPCQKTKILSSPSALCEALSLLSDSETSRNCQKKRVLVIESLEKIIKKYNLGK